MKLARFRTNVLLWICFSSIFFISAWLVPLEGKGGAKSIFASFCQWLRTPPPVAGEAKEVLLFLVMFALVVSVPAMVLGWLAQSLVVMFRSRKKLS